MKIIIISGILAFILSIVATMFFTGTFSRNSEQNVAEDNSAKIENAIKKDKPPKPTAQTAKIANNYNDKLNANKIDSKEIIKLESKNNEIVEKSIELPIKSDVSAKNESNSKESDTKYEQLAKLYSSMKPENAALVMCELEPSMTEKIINKMNERTAGKIMGAIADKDPSYAAKVSKLIVNVDKL